MSIKAFDDKRAAHGDAASLSGVGFQLHGHSIQSTLHFRRLRHVGLHDDRRTARAHCLEPVVPAHRRTVVERELRKSRTTTDQTLEQRVLHKVLEQTSCCWLDSLCKPQVDWPADTQYRCDALMESLAYHRAHLGKNLCDLRPAGALTHDFFVLIVALVEGVEG